MLVSHGCILFCKPKYLNNFQKKIIFGVNNVGSKRIIALNNFGLVINQDFNKFTKIIHHLKKTFGKFDKVIFNPPFKVNVANDILNNSLLEKILRAPIGGQVLLIAIIISI